MYHCQIEFDFDSLINRFLFVLLCAYRENLMKKRILLVVAFISYNLWNFDNLSAKSEPLRVFVDDNEIMTITPAQKEVFRYFSSKSRQDFENELRNQVKQQVIDIINNSVGSEIRAIKIERFPKQRIGDLSPEEQDAFYDEVFSKPDYRHKVAICENINSPMKIRLNDELILEISEKRNKMFCTRLHLKSKITPEEFWKKFININHLKFSFDKKNFEGDNYYYYIQALKKEWARKLADEGVKVPEDNNEFVETIAPYLAAQESVTGLTKEAYESEFGQPSSVEQDLQNRKMILMGINAKLEQIYNIRDIQKKYDQFYQYLPTLLNYLNGLKKKFPDNAILEITDLGYLIDDIQDIVNNPVDLANKFRKLAEYKHAYGYVYNGRDTVKLEYHLDKMKSDSFYKMLFLIKMLAGIGSITDLNR